MLVIFDFTVQSSWIKQTNWVHIEATHHWISFHDNFQTNNDTKRRKRTLQSSLMSKQASPREFARLAREQERGMKGKGGGGGGEKRRKNLFSPPPPPSIFHFFCSRYNFRAITRLGMLASQAYYKEITHHLHGKRRR